MKQELPIAVCLLAAGIVSWSWYAPQKPAATVPRSVEFEGPATESLVQLASFDQMPSDRASSLSKRPAELVAGRLPETPSRSAADFLIQRSDPTAQAMLNRSKQVLEQSPAFESRIRVQTKLFGQSLQGSGTYMQMGQGSGQTRTSLTFQTEFTHKRILQLCDGRFVYHLDHDLDNSSKQLEFYDLLRIQRAANASRSAEASIGTNASRKFFAGGSIAGLLQHLNEMFRFGPIATAVTETAEHYSIDGIWTPAGLRQVVGDYVSAEEVQQGASWDRLPGNFPHAARITMTRSKSESTLELFPTQIIFYRFETSNGKALAQPVVVLQFDRPRLIPEVPADMFAMENLNLEAIDVTQQYISRAQQHVASETLR